jgi:tetratricopeptide (TPR) repeat protein
MRSKSRLPNQGIQIRGILYASILMLVMLLSGSALADDFDGLFRRGMTLYQKKDFEAAIEAFQAAYKVRQFPRVLLNIAQVYRKMGNAQLALDYYQQFIKAEPNPPPKIKVRCRAVHRADQGDARSAQLAVRGRAASRASTERP